MKNDTIATATSFVATKIKNSNGYRSTDKYHRINDLPGNRSRLKLDTIVQTPGGGLIPVRRQGIVYRAFAYFNKASDYAIEKEFLGKKFIFDPELVDGKVRPVLKENEDGYLQFKLHFGRICGICGRKLESDQYRIHFRKEDALVALDLLRTPWHTNSPKFELRIVDGRQTKGKLWLVMESAERTRV